MADNSGTSIQMLAQATGVNGNLASLIAVMRSAFPLSAFKGTFTMAAAATKTVTDANCKTTSVVILQAANAAAGTLEGSAKHLYPTPAAGSFLVSTASTVAAAGTEIYNYLIVNVG
jgi:hypothetical protein